MQVTEQMPSQGLMSFILLLALMAVFARQSNAAPPPHYQFDLTDDLNSLMNAGRFFEAEDICMVLLHHPKLVLGDADDWGFRSRTEARDYAFTNLAELYMRWGRYSEAIPYLNYLVSRNLPGDLYSTKDSLLTDALACLIICDVRTGRLLAAERAVSKISSRTSVSRARSCVPAIAELRLKQGRWQEVGQLYRQWQNECEKKAWVRPGNAMILCQLATVDEHEQHLTEATGNYESAVKVINKFGGRCYPEFVTVLKQYVAFLRRVGKNDYAASLEARANLYRDRLEATLSRDKRYILISPPN
jgi:tetratricopeptide (TPR) repeat protein